MYHTDDLKNYINCPKLFQYMYFNQNNQKIFYSRTKDNISKLGINKLNIRNYYLGKKNDDKNIALNKLNDYQWLIKSRFEYKNLRVKIPFIKKINSNLIDVIFFSPALYPTISDLNYYLSCLLVLNKNNLSINNISILHPNPNYIRGNNIDNNILSITKNFYNSNKSKGLPIIKVLNRSDINLDTILNNMNNINKDDIVLPKTNKSKHSCALCPLKSTCYNNTNECNDSILTLHSSNNKYKLYDKGIRTLKELDINDKYTQTQFAQIMASKNNGEYYHPTLLKSWLDKLSKRPLVFFDFEWDIFFIPPYNKMRPYDVITFQYSLHILDEHNNLIHKEYIGKNDCRKEFIESFLNDIDINSNFICFNALGAEVLRLNEMKSYFPKYSEEISKIIMHTYDLSDIFNLGYYYNIKMNGKYDLKTISQMLVETTYNKSNNIHNGIEAVMLWRNLEKQNNNNCANVKKLLDYCKQDSLNLYKVFCYLSNLVKSY